MKAVVLCAGFGKRLGDLTRDLPKPMLPVNRRPLLEHVLRHLSSHGITQVAVNLHFLPEKIMDHFGDGKRLGISLYYSHEEQPLGTAGALKKLESWLQPETDFLVVYGDVLTDADVTAMIRFHKDHNAAATLLVHQNPSSNSLIVMNSEGRITTFLERPDPDMLEPFASIPAERRWVNSGLQILNQRVLRLLPASGSSDLPRDLYAKHFQTEAFFGYPLRGKRIAIDAPERLAQAEKIFS